MTPGRPKNSRTKEIKTLQERLRQFEGLPISDENRSILEVGKASIREKLKDLSKDRRDKAPPGGK